jgi:fibronectin type 3 domain-containing protein
MLKKLITGLSFIALTACGGGGGDVSTDTSVSVPTGVSALATSDSKVSVSWAYQAHANSYVVYYSTTSPVTKSSLKSNPVNSIYSGINFTGAASGTTYYFAVSASKNLDGSDDTGLSAEVSATTLPSTPSISVNPQDAQAQVSWDAALGATYKIYHSDTPNFTKTNGLANVVTNATSPVTVTGLTNGQPHYFAATAVVAGAEGALSAIQAVIPGAALSTGLAPSVPQLFSANCFFATQPSFSWAKQAGATGYRIYHSTTSPVTTNDAFYAVTSNLGAYSLFASGSPLSGTNYFVITALNGAAESAASTQISCP